MAYPYNNFYELIAFQAKKRGNKVALLIGDEKISYTQIKDKADALATFLSQRGIQKGDKVALFLRNSAEFIYAIFAISKLGAVVVPINTFLKAEELQYILKDSGVKALLASSIHEKVVDGSNASSLCSFIVWEGEKNDVLSFSEVWEELGDVASMPLP